MKLQPDRITNKRVKDWLKQIIEEALLNEKADFSIEQNKNVAQCLNLEISGWVFTIEIEEWV